MKNFKTIYYILAIFGIGLIALVYYGMDPNHKTVPKIKLSYFKDDTEVVTSIESVLDLYIAQEKYFWFGIEPGHQKQIDVLLKLKAGIETKNGPFDLVIYDQELDRVHATSQFFKPHQLAYVKQNWFEISKLIKENINKRILIITASVYSTNLIQHNPLDKIVKDSGLRPLTLSMGYLAATTDEEKNNVFPCKTDDNEGVAAWGCLVINKSRAVRRKIDIKKMSEPGTSILGLMDLTGEKDYMILIR
jgi:hypothetical protein